MDNMEKSKTLSPQNKKATNDAIASKIDSLMDRLQRMERQQQQQQQSMSGVCTMGAPMRAPMMSMGMMSFEQWQQFQQFQQFQQMQRLHSQQLQRNQSVSSIDSISTNNINNNTTEKQNDHLAANTTKDGKNDDPAKIAVLLQRCEDHYSQALDGVALFERKDSPAALLTDKKFEAAAMQVKELLLEIKRFSINDYNQIMSQAKWKQFELAFMSKVVPNKWRAFD